MPFVPNPNVAEAQIRYLQDGQRMVNVLHYLSAAGWDTTKTAALAAALHTVWSTHISPVQSDQVQCTEIAVRDLQDESQPVSVNTVGAVGGLGSPAMPNSVTIAIKLNTAFSGRSFRGRIYHPGLTEGDIVANTLQPTPLAALKTAYDYFKAVAAAGVTYDLCVYSRISLGSLRSVGVATPVTSLTIDPTIDNQRRRLPGRGR